mmetsp:Transcript_29197/g.67205  ORF Transcript_29197/g.67205 Transcript_29197/m.67205 type:complete len:197 (-) Transcript_29197:13-603(-)
MGRKRHAVGDPNGEVTYEGAGDALLTALFEGDLQAADELIEAGNYSVDAADQLGWRALHRAAFGGFTGLISKLIDRKADVHIPDLDGLQPLHVAASCGHVEACKLLLNARAEATAADSNGLTPQCYAMMSAGEAGAQLQEVLGVAADAVMLCQDAESEEEEETEVDAETAENAKGSICSEPEACDGSCVDGTVGAG